MHQAKWTSCLYMPLKWALACRQVCLAEAVDISAKFTVVPLHMFVQARVVGVILIAGSLLLVNTMDC